MELIRSWRHTGFDVYVGGPIEPDNRELLEHIARYLLRAPVSLELIWIRLTSQQRVYML